MNDEHQLPSHEGEGNTPRQPIEAPEITCVRCGHKFPDQPLNPKLMRSKSCTILIWIHPEFMECPKCKQNYAFVFQGVQRVISGWAPVPDELANPKPGPTIVPPPEGFNPVRGAQDILREMQQASDTLKGR